MISFCPEGLGQLVQPQQAVVYRGAEFGVAWEITDFISSIIL